MEDGDGGHHSEALDSDNEPEPLNFNNQNDFPFDPDDIDAPREVQAMAHAMVSLTQGLSKSQNKKQEHEEKRKQREADWTQTKVEDFSADISPFLGAPSGPRGPAALLKSTDSPFKYFQLFFDDKTLDTLVQNTRHYANLSGVGTEKRYPNVSANFMDRSRLLRCMSIMMRHGLRPSPSFKSSFKPESGFVGGDNRLNQIFNEYGWLEWQCFRSFVAMPSRIHLPLWVQIRQQARLSEGLHGQSVPQCEDSGTGQRGGDKEVTLLTNPNPLVTLGNAVPSDVGSWPLP